MTCQGTEWEWDKEEREALKNRLAETSMMAFYDKEAPAEVVGANPVGLRAILVQGVKRAVAFAAVTPVATIPPVKTTTLPTKP